MQSRKQIPSWMYSDEQRMAASLILSSPIYAQSKVKFTPPTKNLKLLH